jgi:tetratricopeptide (TPR) repeat protein
MNEQIQEQAVQGRELLKTGNIAEARRVFTEALKLAPDDADLMTGMADVVRREKNFSTAEGLYRRILAEEPGKPDALLGLGYALRGMKRYQEAIGVWQEFLQIKGERDPFLLTRIADSYRTLGNYEESQKFYLKVLAIKGNNRFAMMGLADLYHKRGMELQAIEYYEKALENGVKLINILTIVANLYYRQGNYEKAREYYEKTLAREPDNSYALYGLGNYYRWKSEYRHAVELWEKILTREAGTGSLMTRLGDAYRNLGRYDEAERSYMAGMRDGYNRYSLVGMIKLKLLQGLLQDACYRYDELLKEEGEDRKVFSEIGEMLVKRKEQDLALQFFRYALQRQDGHPAACKIIEDHIRRLDASAPVSSI